jgi:hypothetical protein
MPKPRRKVIVADPYEFKQWKQATTEQIPTDIVTLQWIVRGLLYRIRRSNSQEANYATMVIRAFTVLENSLLRRSSTVFQRRLADRLSMLLEETPKNNHRLPTLQFQKSLLIDRLKRFERSNRNDMALWLHEEEEKIIQDLTTFPCYCNYATSLQEILAPHRSSPSRKDSKPLCNTLHGIKLIHAILGTLHHLSPTRIETLLKMPIERENRSIDFDRLRKFMTETP